MLKFFSHLGFPINTKTKTNVKSHSIIIHVQLGSVSKNFKNFFLSWDGIVIW
jgi:hypothetical protein